jgi:hypothetical protein
MGSKAAQGRVEGIVSGVQEMRSQAQDRNVILVPASFDLREHDELQVHRLFPTRGEHGELVRARDSDGSATAIVRKLEVAHLRRRKWKWQGVVAA